MGGGGGGGCFKFSGKGDVWLRLAAVKRGLRILLEGIYHSISISYYDTMDLNVV